MPDITHYSFVFQCLVLCYFFSQVGLSSEGKVFVVVGSNRVQPVACAEWSMAELKQVKVRPLPDVPFT